MWFEKACRCLIVASQILHLKYSGVVCIRITCVLATDIAQRIFPQRVHSNLPSSLKNTISGRNSSTYWTSKPENSGIFNSLQCFISLMTSILTGNKVSTFYLKKTLTKYWMPCSDIFRRGSYSKVSKFYVPSLTFFGKKGGNYPRGGILFEGGYWILIQEIQYLVLSLHLRIYFDSPLILNWLSGLGTSEA